MKAAAGKVFDFLNLNTLILMPHFGKDVLASEMNVFLKPRLLTTMYTLGSLCNCVKKNSYVIMKQTVQFFRKISLKLLTACGCRCKKGLTTFSCALFEILVLTHMF